MADEEKQDHWYDEISPAKTLLAALALIGVFVVIVQLRRYLKD